VLSGIFSKTTILILVPLVVLVDIAAVISLLQDLHPGSYAEPIFLLLSLIFFIFAGFTILKKDKKDSPDLSSNRISPTNSEIDEKPIITKGRF